MRALAWVLLAMSSGVGSAIEFQEVSGDAGVLFRHAASKSPEKHLLEAMGSGVAMLDYNGDGRIDLYFVNGADLSGASGEGGPNKEDPRFWNRLYENGGGWRFRDVTAEAGVAGRGYGMGAAVADYDADGDPDLFVSNFGTDILYRNEGDGTFLDVSAEAGLSHGGWSSGAVFLDFDNDGRIDLFVARYLRWTLETSRPCGDALPDRRSYCHPRQFGPATHLLYRNLGGGRFEDVSEAAGLAGHPGKGLGVALNDYDGDGWVDLFVANDSYPQQLFRNAGGKGLVETAVLAGAAYDSDGHDYAGMGVVWEDFDGDARPDLLVNALGRQGYWLYRNRNGRFEPVSDVSGIAALSELRSGWGMGLEDFDNDGWRDLLVAQGHVMDDIGDSDPALAHEEPLMIARNLFGRFYDVSGRAGSVFREALAARGAAFGDLDADGRIDVAVVVNDGPALLLRNTSAAGNSVSIRLEGVGGNRDGIGAVASVTTREGRETTAFRQSAGSYLSSNAPDLHFGLGDQQCCKSVTVRWPDGTTQAVPDPESPLIVIRQADPR